MVLTFNDLAVLQEGRLDPGLRVLLMGGLGSVVGLSWTGAVRFSTGMLDSQAIMASGAAALLVGAVASAGHPWDKHGSIQSRVRPP